MHGGISAGQSVSLLAGSLMLMMVWRNVSALGLSWRRMIVFGLLWAALFAVIAALGNRFGP